MEIGKGALSALTSLHTAALEKLIVSCIHFLTLSYHKSVWLDICQQDSLLAHGLELNQFMQGSMN